MNNNEIETRFLNIDVEKVKGRLIELGAKDQGEDMLSEIIFYDKELTWATDNKLAKLRKKKGIVTCTYKNQQVQSISGTEEIEFIVSDMEKATLFLERIGLVAFRHQEKRRHTFILGNVTCDIDTWPNIPTYIELESDSENAVEEIMSTAIALGFSWQDAIFENPAIVIEKYYNIPVRKLRFFTFSKME